MAKKMGIYAIECSVNGKMYIGRTKDINSRISQHFGYLRKNTHPNRHLQEDYNKFGRDAFTNRIICLCPEKALDFLEVNFIKYYKSLSTQNGYNIEAGGNRNKIIAEETRKIVSSKLSGVSWSEERKAEFRKGQARRIAKFKANYRKENHPNYGKKFSPERIRRIIERKGKTGDVEKAVKMYVDSYKASDKVASECNIGKVRFRKILRERGLMRVSPAYNHDYLMIAISKRKSLKGVPRSIETRRKLQIAALRRYGHEVPEL